MTDQQFVGTPASTSRDIVGHIDTAKSNWNTAYLEQIKRWHRKCVESHEACRRTLSQCDEFDAEDVPLPSRCIEIVPYQQGGSWKERWILKETHGEQGRYIALSHRWREETERAMTRVANMRCRMGEPCGHDHGPYAFNDVWRDNTPLFREAGHLAALLGVRYLWIDSICIIQDSPGKKDWEHEATKMADYYQYAWLTIAATTLSKDGGLFKSIEMEDLPRVTRLPYMAIDGRQQGHIYVQCAGETALATDYKTYVSHSELLQRGWVFQEWMLSRRLVTLSNCGLFLTCAGTPQPQSIMGDPVVNTRNGWQERTEDFDIAFSKYGLRLGKTRRAICEQWWQIVEIYSGLQLTKLEEDRLAALAGLAREFGRAIDEVEGKELDRGNPELSCRYVSGMWFGDIRGLLWEQRRNGPRTRVKGFPTWSWASIGSLDDSQGDPVPCGMSVRWERPWVTNRMEEKLSKETKAARKEGRKAKELEMFFKILCSAERAFRASVSNQSSRVPSFHTISLLNRGTAYCSDNRFSILELRGRVAVVNIGKLFETQEERDIVARLTDHHTDIGRDLWRQVTTEDKPDSIVGWASLEHPDFQTDAQIDQSPSLLRAFFVLDNKNLDYGLGFGNLTTSHIAFNVLFLRKLLVEGLANCYERVGTGRLFGTEVDALYQSKEMGQVLLL